MFGRLAISNLSLYLVIGQVFVLLGRLLNLVDVSKLLFVPGLVVEGEWWGAFTFMLVIKLPE